MNPYQPPANYSVPQSNQPNPPQQPQSKYPQLPPVNQAQTSSPQNPYNPQQQHHQPIIPAVNHSNHSSYVPPSQYALLGVNPVIPDSQTLLTRKIQDIDLRFENGWLLLYKAWLMLMIVGCSLMFLLLFALYGGLLYQGTIPASAYYFAPAIMGLSGWLIYQGLSLRGAMNKKDLVEAKKAYKSMWWFAIFYLVFVVCFFATVSSEISQGESWVQTIYWYFIGIYIIPMWINLAGARKVTNLLEKKEALLLELDTRASHSA